MSFARQGNLMGILLFVLASAAWILTGKPFETSPKKVTHGHQTGHEEPRIDGAPHLQTATVVTPHENASAGKVPPYEEPAAQDTVMPSDGTGSPVVQPMHAEVRKNNPPRKTDARISASEESRPPGTALEAMATRSTPAILTAQAPQISLPVATPSESRSEVQQDIPIPLTIPTYPVAVLAAETVLEEFTTAECQVIDSLADSFDADVAPQVSGPGTVEEEAAFRERSAEAHDDHLRLTLGWEAFNRLSVVAARQSATNPAK